MKGLQLIRISRPAKAVCGFFLFLYILLNYSLVLTLADEYHESWYWFLDKDSAEYKAYQAALEKGGMPSHFEMPGSLSVPLTQQEAQPQSQQAPVPQSQSDPAVSNTTNITDVQTNNNTKESDPDFINMYVVPKQGRPGGLGR